MSEWGHFSVGGVVMYDHFLPHTFTKRSKAQPEPRPCILPSVAGVLQPPCRAEPQSPSHTMELLGMFLKEVRHLRIILNFAVEELVVLSLLHPPHSYEQWGILQNRGLGYVKRWKRHSQELIIRFNFLAALVNFPCMY